MLTEMDGVETLKNVKHHNYYKFLKIIYIIIIHIKKYFEIFSFNFLTLKPNLLKYF